MTALSKKEILGVGITSATEEQILEYIFSSVKNQRESYYIVTPNPEILMHAHAHPEFKSILNKAEIALCDGVGVSLAASLLGMSLKSRVTGVDLLESICKRSVKEGRDMVRNPISIGFLGAGKGVALKVAECLTERYPGLRVVFANEEWSPDGFTAAKALHGTKQNSTQNHAEDFSVVQRGVQQSSAVPIDVLFVAFGFPRQEEWMAEHSGELPVKVMMGVGGAFDYISGKVPRAPGFMRALGLEWLFRLIRQPWRWKRQLVLPAFMFAVLKDRLFMK
jgi:N-acetylglucosaminyldiphosphoundecaprenol N-acetyl-beta-D-mannosaminyltransferase